MLALELPSEARPAQDQALTQMLVLMLRPVTPVSMPTPLRPLPLLQLPMPLELLTLLAMLRPLGLPALLRMRTPLRLLVLLRLLVPLRLLVLLRLLTLVPAQPPVVVRVLEPVSALQALVPVQALVLGLGPMLVSMPTRTSVLVLVDSVVQLVPESVRQAS